MEFSGASEQKSLKTTAFIKTHTSEYKAVDFCIEAGLITIATDPHLQIPLKAIESVVTSDLELGSEAGLTQPFKLNQFQITYVSENGKRFFVNLSLNREDAETIVNIFKNAGIGVNPLNESGTLNIRPSLEAKLYLSAPGGQFEITRLSINNGILSVSSGTPFSIPLASIESTRIVTTKIRTGKKPDDVPLLMKTVEITYNLEPGLKQIYSFGIDSAEAEILKSTLEAEKISIIIEEKLDVRLEYAGFWRRVGANFIDGIILQTASSVIVGILALIAVIIGASSQEQYGEIFLQNTVFIAEVGSLIYYLFFWTKSGRTPGKMATGMKIVKIDGSDIKIGRAILRYFGYLIDFPLTLGIGYLWIAWDTKKQGLHDKIAGTCVIKV